MISRVLDLLFPQGLYCLSCGRPLQHSTELPALCSRCAEEIIWANGHMCEKCGRPISENNPGGLCSSCMESPRVFKHGFACALYAGRAADLVRDMKYREKPYIADTLAYFLNERYRAAADPETGELPTYDFVINVPMHAKKRARRGYDQAELMAKKFARITSLPFLPHALVRVVETSAQSSLSAIERRNIERAFIVSPPIANRLTDARVLLVDDVLTTGSTADACAETLVSAGSASVDLIVFAAGSDA